MFKLGDYPRTHTNPPVFLGALLVPAGVSLIWFVIFGRTALHSILGPGGNEALLNASASQAIFVVLNQLPPTAVIHIRSGNNACSGPCSRVRSPPFC